jgi:hypothetical protein
MDEFGEHNEVPDWKMEGAIPDLTWNIPGGYLIVEVGHTDANKIVLYKKNLQVAEIRWYDFDGTLAFYWRKDFTRGNEAGPWTIHELSDFLHRSPSSIRNMVLRRQIPFRKSAGRLIFFRWEVERWLNAAPGLTLEEWETRYKDF